jgi:hypothetical protein
LVDVKKKTLPLNSLIAGAAGLVCFALAPHAGAELLMYEGFAYGAASGDLINMSGSALGLDGTSYSGDDRVDYDPAGLTFGSLQTSGGHASLGYNASAFNASRGLNFNITSGTLYGSFLFQAYDDAGGDGGISPIMFGSTTSDNTSELALAGNTASGGGVHAGLKIYGNQTVAAGSSLTIDTTYLVLFQVNNMGALDGDTQLINLWVLSEAQFENFRSLGLTDSLLNAASLGDEATSVWQRVSYELPVTGSNNISLTDTDQFVLFSWRSKYLVDEVRLSNASLNEVTPIPEATSALLMGCALGGLALRRRRS